MTLKIFSALVAMLTVVGCSGMVAPTNEGAGPGSTTKNATTRTETTGGDTTGGETTGGETTGGETEGGETEGGETDEGEVVGSATDVSGDFGTIDFKNVQAVHRGSYKIGQLDNPASLTITMSDQAGSTKKVKEYKCLACEDSKSICFCAKDENKNDEKCKSKPTNGNHTFMVIFSGKSASVTVESGETYQVADDGYPKKKDYELIEVPSLQEDLTGYTANTKKNQLEGLSVFYTFSGTPAKSRSTVVGTAKLADNALSPGKEFEIDLDLKFVPSLADSAAEQAFKGKFKGPVSEYYEPVPYPTDCSLPEKYVEAVYE